MHFFHTMMWILLSSNENHQAEEGISQDGTVPGKNDIYLSCTSCLACMFLFCRRSENGTPYDKHIPDSKVHGANMGPIWGRQDPGGPHVGPWTLLSESLSGTYTQQTQISWNISLCDFIMGVISNYNTYRYWSMVQKWIYWIKSKCIELYINQAQFSFGDRATDENYATML